MPIVRLVTEPKELKWKSSALARSFELRYGSSPPVVRTVFSKLLIEPGKSGPFARWRCWMPVNVSPSLGAKYRSKMKSCQEKMRGQTTKY